MKYIKQKFQGYISVDVHFLQDELLLSKKEFIELKRELASRTYNNRCPSCFSLEEFSDLADKYLA